MSISAQFNKGFYRSVKEVNSSIYNLDDSTIFIRYKSINRFKQDSFTLFQVLNIKENNSKDFLAYSAELNRNSIYHNNRITLVSWNGDTLPIKEMGNVNLDEYHPSSFYYLMTAIPTRKKGDFSRLRYSKPEICRSNRGTYTLTQWDRKFKEYRVLHVDSQHRITSMRRFNSDFERVDSASEFEFYYYKQNCFDSLSQIYKLGRYKDISANKNLVLSQNASPKDTIWLRSGDFDLTANYKFLLLDFWYLSCRPCIEMHPFIESLNKIIDTNKLLILGVNQHDDTDDIYRYLSRKNYTTVQFDADKIRVPFSFDLYPTIVIVDSNWNVLFKHHGFGGQSTQRTIIQELKQLGLLKE